MSSSAQATTQQIRLEMAKTNDLFNTEVFSKRNFESLDQIYTVDACILPPGSPMISGRNAIKQFWSDLVQSVNAKAAVLDSLDVISAGDGAIEIGRATLTVAPADAPEAQMEAKYVVHWKHEEGRWKWNIDIWNMDA